MQALHRSSRHALQALLRPASANHTPAPTQSAHLLNRSSGGTRQSSVSPFVRGHALRRSLCHPSGQQPPLAGPDQFVVFRLRAAAVGLGSGALGACAGIGGAVFIVPGLMRYCALAQPAAAATSMAAVCAVSTTCAVAHSTADGVQWETAALMAAAAALATPLGATLAPKLDPNKLRALFGGFLVLLAPIMPLRSYLMSRQSVSDNAAFVNAGSAPPYDGLLARNESVVVVGDRYMAKHFVIALGGLGIGFGSGLLGVGGGSLMTPLIACLHPELPLTSIPNGRTYPTAIIAFYWLMDSYDNGMYIFYVRRYSYVKCSRSHHKWCERIPEGISEHVIIANGANVFRRVYQSTQQEGRIRCASGIWVAVPDGRILRTNA